MGNRHDKIERRREYRAARFRAAQTPEDRLTVALDSIRAELVHLAAIDATGAVRERDRIASLLLDLAGSLEPCRCFRCRIDRRRSA